MDVLHFLFGIFVLCTNSIQGNEHEPPACMNLTRILHPSHQSVTFRRILKNKSTEEFSGVPYIMTLLNCLLSAWYGLPFVSPNNLLVSTINGAGAAIEAVYALIFIAHAPPKRRGRTICLLGLVVTVFAAIALVSVLALHGNKRKLFCGVAATVFSIIMYGSPLSVMRLVVTTRSVEFMPFFLSLFSFLCGTSWFVYGLLGRDLFVTVPNGCGCALGAVQLALYAIYRKNRGGDGAAVEMVDDQKKEMNGGGGGGYKGAAVDGRV